MRRRILVLASLLVAPLAVHAQELTITMLPEAVVDDTVVTLDQVARIGGGGTALRKRLAKLDVADFPCTTGQRIITGEQVRFRLLLADLEPSEFRVTGARRTLIIESDAPVTMRKLIAAAEQAVRDRYPGNPAGLTITLGKGLALPVLELRPGERVRLDAVVAGPVPVSGRARVEVALLVNGKRREVMPVAVDIAQQAADQPIRAVANWAPAGSSSDVLIKAHDNVKLVAILGSARVEAVGEAQQDGKVGQVIRVRNVESNRIVHGRVEANGMVTVEY